MGYVHIHPFYLLFSDTSPQLGMGLGGPIGGLVTDWFVH